MQKTNLCASLLLAAALCGPMAARTALAADQSDQGSDQGSEQAAAPAQTSGVGRGSVGVGMGYLPGRLGVVPTLSVDWWLADRLGLEIEGGGTNYSENLGGTTLAGKQDNSTVDSFGAALAAKLALARSKYALFEVIVRGSYVNEGNSTPNGGVTSTTDIGTVGGFAGIAIEGLVFRSASAEISSGFNYLASTTTNSSSVKGSTSTSFTEGGYYLGGSGLGLPVTFAFHYYF
jgi:hypothetical protein